MTLPPSLLWIAIREHFTELFEIPDAGGSKSSLSLFSVRNNGAQMPFRLDAAEFVQVPLQ